MKHRLCAALVVWLGLWLWPGDGTAGDTMSGGGVSSSGSQPWVGGHNNMPRQNLSAVGTVFTPATSFGNYWIVNNAAGQSVACPPDIADGDSMNVHIQYGAGAPYSPAISFSSPCYGWASGTQPVWSESTTKADWAFCQSMNPVDTSGASFVCSPQLNAMPLTTMSVLSAATSTLSASTGVTSQTVSLNLTTGTLLIVGVGNNNGSTGAQITSITGTGISGCASYTGVASGVRFYLQIWHCAVGATGTGVPVTVNLGSTGQVTVSALDVSGANATPDDGVGNYNDTGLTLPTGTSYSISGTGNTTKANDLVVVCAMALNPTTVTVGAGYTVVGTPTSQFGCGYQSQAAIATPSGTMNFAASTIGAIGIAATKGQ